MDEQMLEAEITEELTLPYDTDPALEPETEITVETEEDDTPTADYDGEIALLREQYPELLHESGAERYRELRMLGLTPGEAYRATAAPKARADGRAHLGTAPRRAHSPHTGMSRSVLESARSLFEGLGDAELHRLYRRVTK